MCKLEAYILLYHELRCAKLAVAKIKTLNNDYL